MKTFTCGTLSLALCAALALAARADDKNTASSSYCPTAQDNTAHNKGDGDASAITPFSQSEAAADLEVTKNIRSAIENDKTLSVDAKNIKIITTANEVVYLRGVVENRDECERIVSLAKPFLGDRRLKNEIKNRS